MKIVLEASHPTNAQGLPLNCRLASLGLKHSLLPAVYPWRRW